MPGGAANLSPVPMGPPSALPAGPMPSMNMPTPNLAAPSAPSVRNPLPHGPVLPPATAPSTHHSGWRLFWWIAIPVIALLLLAALWRYLIGRTRRRPLTDTYTGPVARTPDEPTDLRDAGVAGETTAAAPITAIVPPQPEPEVTRPMIPVTDAEPVTGRYRDDLVTYELREPDGRRQELHYVDPDSGDRAPGEWVDAHGTPEREVNQSWWKPGVRDTGQR
jgi:hypothetical protein